MKMTRTTVAVLCAFLEAGRGTELYGLEIMDSAGIRSGTLYPILHRLEQAGWITGAWEDVAVGDEGRPRRRYYRLTPEGAGQASAVASRQAQSRLASRPDVARPVTL
jgi:PadR family transcriptional regulator PadR